MPIVSERLLLIPLSPEFLEAGLAEDAVRAAELLGYPVPRDWFAAKHWMEVRREQLRADPRLQPWLLRALVDPAVPSMVGHAGCHSGPGPEYLRELGLGGVELGYTVYPAFRRRGYATEACAALMRWAAAEHGVRQFVLSIRPDNEASLRIAHRFGFKKVAEHLDEVDGLEHVFLLEGEPPKQAVEAALSPTPRR